jgi:hypothetical protein
MSTLLNQLSRLISHNEPGSKFFNLETKSDNSTTNIVKASPCILNKKVEITQAFPDFSNQPSHVDNDHCYHNTKDVEVLDNNDYLFHGGQETSGQPVDMEQSFGDFSKQPSYVNSDHCYNKTRDTMIFEKNDFFHGSPEISDQPVHSYDKDDHCLSDLPCNVHNDHSYHEKISILEQPLHTSVNKIDDCFQGSKEISELPAHTFGKNDLNLSEQSCQTYVDHSYQKFTNVSEQIVPEVAEKCKISERKKSVTKVEKRLRIQNNALRDKLKITRVLCAQLNKKVKTFSTAKFEKRCVKD